MIGLRWLRGRRAAAATTDATTPVPPDRWWRSAGYGAWPASDDRRQRGRAGDEPLPARAPLPKDEFVATGAWFFFVVNLVKLPIYAGHGLIDRRSLLFDLALAPSVVAGALLGRALLRRCRRRRSIGW